MLFCLSYNDKQTLRTNMRRLKSMRCSRKGSRGCFRVERLISPILIGRNQQDLLTDWSNTFYVSPTIELIRLKGVGSLRIWHVVCDKYAGVFTVLVYSRHASATLCQTETISGCENEKKNYKSEKVEARKP